MVFVSINLENGGSTSDPAQFCMKKVVPGDIITSFWVQRGSAREQVRQEGEPGAEPRLVLVLYMCLSPSWSVAMKYLQQISLREKTIKVPGRIVCGNLKLQIIISGSSGK